MAARTSLATAKRPKKAAKSAVAKKTTSPANRAKAPRSAPAPAVAPTVAMPDVKLDKRRALALVTELMAIPGGSGDEAAVASYVRKKLLAAGAPADAIQFDNAHRRTPLPGNCGNLIFQLPGTLKAPRRLLMAHLDTVPICIGAKPTRKGETIVSANKQTGLGADDRAGVATLLSTALTILENRLPHPPLTFLWVIQEEVGLYGARNVELRRLGKPKLAFNFDGGPAEKLTSGATGGYRLKIDIEGLASHAGGAPEQGVSAIAIAALAIADLVEHGWHGAIQKEGHLGTSNVGVIQGGAATNVVTDQVAIRAEARSHDPAFRNQIVAAIRDAFERAAAAVKNNAGRSGKVTFDGRLDYESFRLADDEPCLLAAEAAVGRVGGVPLRSISNGGLDANWMSARGIPTVTLGCGQVNIHTTSESLDIGQFQTACRIALTLATGGEISP
jgi:tripeptide aminopeptidase